MPQSATLPTGGGDPIAGTWSNLPGLVKIGLIGGGLGLALFLYKRGIAGGGGSSTNQPTSQSGQLVDSTYGLPNTAVMLGSLQQEMLNLSGQQGADTANLSDLISGGFENVGSLFDAQTSAIQGGLTDLQNNVINNQNTNTQSILDSLSARSDLLQQLIQTSSGAEQAAFQSFADSTAKGLGAIASQQNAELAAIGALGNNVSTQQASIISQITSLQNTTTGLVSQVSGLSQRSNLAVGQYFKWYNPQTQNWGIGVVNSAGQLTGFSTWTGYLNSGGSPDTNVINAYPTISASWSSGSSPTGGQSWAPLAVSS